MNKEGKNLSKIGKYIKVDKQQPVYIGITKEQYKEYLYLRDNSIPTETIKTKKQKLEKEYKEAMQINPTKAFIIKCQLKLIDELLEGK